MILIELIKEGNDARAEAELVKRYQSVMFYWLLRKVRNPEDAKDIMFDSFTKALINIHKYNSEYAFSTWLFAIANHKWIDFVRRMSKRPTIVSFDKPIMDEKGGKRAMELQSANLTPEELMIKAQQAELLNEMIENLCPSYRDVVKLRYFEDCSYKEISEQLNIPIGTAKVRTLRAKKELRKYMRASVNA